MSVYAIILGVAVAAAVVFITFLRPIWNDICTARIVVAALRENGPLPDTAHQPLSGAMEDYRHSFKLASDKNALPTFSVNDHLVILRRVSASRVAFPRAVAGVLILCGLLLTLIMLQGSVGSLGHAFQKLAAEQAPAAVENRGFDHDNFSTDSTARANTTSVVTDTMSNVASSARSAFLCSFAFITLAAFVLAVCALMQSRSDAAAISFAQWAQDAYDQSLPPEVSLGTIALKLQETANGLEGLTGYFHDLIGSFHSLGDFASSMQQARHAIEDAMEKLPANIETSMGKLSHDFVERVADGLRDTAHYTKEILAVYGHQRVQVEQLYQHFQAVRDYTQRVEQSTAFLTLLPDQIDALQKAAVTGAAANTKLESTVAELAIRVEELPVTELRDDVIGLATATGQIMQEVIAVQHFAENVAIHTSLLRGLPERMTEIRQAVAEQCEASGQIRDTVRQLGVHVRDLPVVELRAGIAEMTSTAKKVGSLHAQTISVLDDMVLRAEDMGKDIIGRFDKLVIHSAQFSREFQVLGDKLDGTNGQVLQALERVGSGLLSEIEAFKAMPGLPNLGRDLGRLELNIRAMRGELAKISTHPASVTPSSESVVDSVEPAGA